MYVPVDWRILPPGALACGPEDRHLHIVFDRTAHSWQAPEQRTSEDGAQVGASPSSGEANDSLHTPCRPLLRALGTQAELEFGQIPTVAVLALVDRDRSGPTTHLADLGGEGKWFQRHFELLEEG